MSLYQSFNLKYFFTFFLFMMTLVRLATAQGIVGPNPVGANSTYTYYFTSSHAMDYDWEVTGGDVTSVTEIGTTYSIEIHWGSAGEGEIILKEFDDSDGREDAEWITRSRRDILINSCSVISAPILGNTSRCGPGTIVLTTSAGNGGNNVRWYDTPSSTVVLATGTSFTTPSLTSSRTYYVTTFNSTSGCESLPKTPLLAQVHNFPQPAPMQNFLTCGLQEQSVTAASGQGGNSVRWYTSAAGTTLLHTGLVFTQTFTATTSYYISSYNSTTGCESYPTSPLTQATVNVNPTPPTVTPVVSNTCRFGEGIFSLQATGAPSGGTFHWYRPGNSVTSGNSFTTSNITSSITNYIEVRAVDATGCEGPGLWVNLTVVPKPVILTTSTIITLAKPETLTSEVTTYDSYIWTNSAGEHLSDGVSYETGVIDTYTLTVTECGLSSSTSFTFNNQFDGLNKNFIVTNTVGKEIESSAQIESLPAKFNNQTIQYFDGIGRPSQNVVTQGSPDKNDIIQPIEYDEYGRQKFQYLPYASTEHNGRFKENSVSIEGQYSGSAHNLFYTNETEVKIARDLRPFSETRFESSPNNRTLKQGAPGLAWKPDEINNYSSNDHTVKSDYEFNVANEVLNFDNIYPNETYPQGFVKFSTSLYYPANQLYKKKTKDEQNNEVFEYLDKNGKVILKKVKADATTYAQTYYIYDDMGNLVCVLPPEATSLILPKLPISWNINQNVTVAPGNVLVKNSGVATAWNAGSTSSTMVALDTDGWVETRADETNTTRMIGLSSTNTVNENIQYAIEMRNDNQLYAWESGASVWLGLYIGGTTLRVAREGMAINYYVDGKLLKTTSVTTRPALLVDVSMYTPLGTLRDVNISFSASITLQQVVSNYGFLYTYDEKHRMIQKQLPGVLPVYLVYDDRDRLVLSQDGNLRKDINGGDVKKWMFTKYDALNRPLLTGIYTEATVLSQSEMQSKVDLFYTNGGTKFETFVGNGGAVHGYTNVSYPLITNPDEYLTATYYDNYNFKTQIGSTAFDPVYNALPPDYINNLPGQETTFNFNVTGQVTGTKVKMLYGESWLRTVNYYDDKYRLVQQIEENPKGHSVTTNVFDFPGKLWRTKTSLFTGQPVAWTNKVKVITSGEYLIGDNITTQWTGGASSTQTLAATADGWIEITVPYTDLRPGYAFGFNDTMGGAAPTDMDYSITVANGIFSIREINPGTGTQLIRKNLITVMPGEVLRIERVNGIVYYKRNGSISYTSLTPSATLLYMDASISATGGKLMKARLSPSFAIPATYSPAQEFVKRFDYDHAGRLTKTGHAVNGAGEVLLSENKYNEIGQLTDKNLHSADGESFKQQIDYRYSVRGWLTRINNSDLEIEESEPKDLFGMNLMYQDLDNDLDNTGYYNGNISAMKWSKDAGFGDEKEFAYLYSYDALSRLTNASHKILSATGWDVGYYDESGISYDLNGNIKTLQRKGDNAVQIDNLAYSYLNGTIPSNKLRYVKDDASSPGKLQGFDDFNPGTAVDYTYDNNGNMVTDRNKGIDNGNIQYNYLNLPSVVTKTNNSVAYVYDATGRKWSQHVSYGATNNLTSYIGPWVFQGNEPSLLQHEEGRVLLSEEKTIFSTDGDDASVFTTTSDFSFTPVVVNEQTMIRMTPASGQSLQKTGANTIGGYFDVTEGERYLFRVKGYYTGAPAKSYLCVQGNTGDIVWQGATMSANTSNVWVETTFIVPPGVTQINLAIFYSHNSLSTGAQNTYIDGIELIRYKPVEPEYQYDLKDHLGNVRLTFTTKENIDEAKATMETANESTEAGQFLRYDKIRKVTHQLFDHTNGTALESTGAAISLSGVANEKLGLTKSLALMSGDQVHMKVYVKYFEEEAKTGTGVIATLLQQVMAGSSGMVVDGPGYSTSGSTTLPIDLIDHSGDGNSALPMAYLNFVMMDKNFDHIVKVGSIRVSSAAKENTDEIDNGHELLELDLLAEEQGYVYIYLSNDNDDFEVFFDDFSVEHIKSSIVQSQDYYPFGLTYNACSRENSTSNNFLYNGKELQDEINLGWLDYGARMYQPDVGRWGVVDPKSEKYYNFSTYNYGLNNPVLFLDPNGEDVYLFYYLTDNHHEDEEQQESNAMFWAAALTRATDMLQNGEIKEGDKYIIKGIDCMENLQSTIEGDVAANKEEFGKTKEVGLWSHSGLDGPFRNNADQSLDQLSISNWAKIDFNWAEEAKIGIYGCRSGKDPDENEKRKDDGKDEQSFAQNLSCLPNMANVNVWGQSRKSWPSPYTNVRVTTSDISRGIHGYPTYMVGSIQNAIVGFTSRVLRQPTYAYPMAIFKNGIFIGYKHQPGQKSE